MRYEQLPLAVRRVAQAGADVMSGQVREVVEDLPLAHPGRQIGEPGVDRDPQPADARLAAPLARVDRDELPLIHRRTLR